MISEEEVAVLALWMVGGRAQGEVVERGRMRWIVVDRYTYLPAIVPSVPLSVTFPPRFSITSPFVHT